MEISISTFTFFLNSLLNRKLIKNKITLNLFSAQRIFKSDFYIDLIYYFLKMCQYIR